MNKLLSKFSTALEAASCLLATDALPLKTRGAVLAEVLSQCARRSSAPARIPFKEGTLTLDAVHYPDWRVYRGVFVRKEYATDYRDSVVVDVGAHRGLFAAFALRSGCAALLAYEPEPANFAFLEENAHSFSAPGREVRTRACCVGGVEGQQTLFTYDQSWSHSLCARPDRTSVATLDVRQVALEAVLEEAASMAEKGQRIIVKIDAEGAEYDMLHQTPTHALEKIDELFVETHDYAGRDAEALKAHLAAGGLTFARRPNGPFGEHELLHLTRAEGTRRTPA